MQPQSASETIPFACSLGRVAFSSVHSVLELPSKPTATRDGYAIPNLKRSSVESQEHSIYCVIGCSRAGDDISKESFSMEIKANLKKVFSARQYFKHRSPEAMQDYQLFPAMYVTTGGHVPTAVDLLFDDNDLPAKFEPLNVVVEIEYVESLQDQVLSSTLFSLLGSEMTLFRLNPGVIGKGRYDRADMNLRPIGNDMKRNTLILEKGEKISSAHIGLLAMSGICSVVVYRKLIVGVLSTGDEVADVSQAGQTSAAQIFDVNRPLLLSLLSEVDLLHKDIILVDLGILSDDDLKHLLTTESGYTFPFSLEKSKSYQHYEQFDVIISTGGVSKGDRDYFKALLLKNQCRVVFDKLWLKPGKPTHLSVFTSNEQHDTSRCTLVFSLPGNPVSAFVTFQLLVRTALHFMQHPPFRPLTRVKNGRHASSLDLFLALQFLRDLPENLGHNLMRAECIVDEDIPLDRARPEYHRAWIVNKDRNPSERLRVRSTDVKNQMSSNLFSVRGADLLLKLPSAKEYGSLKCLRGSIVEGLLLSHSLKKVSEVLEVVDSIEARQAQRLEITILRDLLTMEEDVKVIDLVGQINLRHHSIVTCNEKASTDKATADSRSDVLWNRVCSVIEDMRTSEDQETNRVCSAIEDMRTSEDQETNRVILVPISMSQALLDGSASLMQSLLENLTNEKDRFSTSVLPGFPEWIRQQLSDSDVMLKGLMVEAIVIQGGNGSTVLVTMDVQVLLQVSFELVKLLVSMHTALISSTANEQGY